MVEGIIATMNPTPLTQLVLVAVARLALDVAQDAEERGWLHNKPVQAVTAPVSCDAREECVDLLSYIANGITQLVLMPPARNFRTRFV